ncbi:MAG: hypothetical protein CL868_13790 [Cytophagaceae bacterium]|nr:hypothetical protein [Cytophagaceae bacterium]|tara:strand:- start:24617 stop:25444 length:828 start_codon:yes stop_codon:yes gene_type:complete
METSLVAHPIIPEDEMGLIKKMKHDLEHVSFVMKVFNTVGTPIDAGLVLIPEKYQNKINLTAQKALQVSIRANLATMQKDGAQRPAMKNAYKLVTGISGAAGGFFGAAGFTADLLVSTKFMMRSILDIARSQGEDLNTIETQLACMQVFALGGNSKDDDDLDIGYYAVCAALHSATAQAKAYIAEQGTKNIIKSVASQGSSPVAKFISQVASRYSIQVGEKFAAQAVPIIGAIAGSSINIVFISHFQKMATAHFTMRRLERKYGKEEIEAVFLDL